MMIEGSVNTLAFEAYVEHILAPSLVAGQIVVLDNVSAHKGARVRQLIEARGCELLFLPAYSPDYSPIEETFSKLKAFLRRVAARTHEALQEAIGQALETVTAQDALGWFTIAHPACASRRRRPDGAVYGEPRNERPSWVCPRHAGARRRWK